MSRRHHRRRKGQSEVELNLAAMLDMAFQLLAFFIFTFKPAPVEGQLALNMPPARPATDISAANSKPSDGPGIEAAKSLIISVFANKTGETTAVQVGFATVFQGPATDSNLFKLGTRLKAIFGLQDSPFEQVLIRAHKDLRYDHLMKVMEVCLQQKTADGKLLEKISFTELPEQAKPAK